jgi:RHH-type proline utilization regulon transcriptional repressor/proline dehydrogenase/delta 1-pyrroline-5-carboxylate dehydrogenase
LAYLVRRLDENTAPANFLPHIFSMSPDSETWNEQKERFLEAWQYRDRVNQRPRRSLPAEKQESGFFNEPDTDWTQKLCRMKLSEAISRYIPSEPPPPVDRAGIDTLLARAASAQVAWEKQGVGARAEILERCADQMGRRRFNTIVALTREGKKAAVEADIEVSEAIDFARYYADLAVPPMGLKARAVGTVVIVPPWNFPYAIPCGGVLAALVAGNSVVLKPAPETVGIGWLLARQFWDAGVPLEVLQFVHCLDGDTGRKLITDSRTSAVVLTGAWETANLFREWRPALKLFAETSGKNAIVVSVMADRELAVRDLVRSPFSHAGQKCSAASLGILEAEVYNDPVFRRQLRDAAASLPVGSAEDLSSVVTPLIRPPGEALTRALTSLDEGEEWLLEPQQDSGNPCLWSPGIKIGVKSGSWFHQTECFGPVLGLMSACDLEEAVRLQNGVQFGLTAGFQSLDEDEISWWQDRAEAGNLYINRGITGAIVRRQAFGGWKRSCVRPGAKAGGPNYLNQFTGIP